MFGKMGSYPPKALNFWSLPDHFFYLSNENNKIRMSNYGSRK